MGKLACHVAAILPLPEGQLAQSVGDAHVPFPCGKEATPVIASSAESPSVVISKTSKKAPRQGAFFVRDRS